MAGLAEDLSIESDDERVLVGHNGRWPNALNRAAILRLPAVQPEEVANGGFPIWRMPTPCPKRPVAPRSVQRRVTEDSSHSGKMLTDRTSAKTAIGLRRSNGQQTAAFQPFNLE